MVIKLSNGCNYIGVNLNNVQVIYIANYCIQGQICKVGLKQRCH